MKPGFVSYLGFLFQPFFRWWWAAVTGIASILGVLVTPRSGFVVKPWVMFLVTFAVFALVFLTLTSLIQGWELYQKRFPDLRVISVQRTTEHGGEYIALLCGDMDVPAGTLVELRRPIEESDTLFAMVEVRNRNVLGNYLGIPIWTSPGHQRDLFRGKFSASQLFVIPYVQRATLDRYQAEP